MYIGSSVDIRGRLLKHFQQLRKNKHPNKHLQNAWNLDQGKNFTFDVISFVEKEKLEKQEEFFIKFYQSHTNIGGYNNTSICERKQFSKVLSSEKRMEICKKLKQILHENSKNFALISPEGKLHIGKNIKQFAEKHGLHQAHLSAVLLGHKPHHKGWTKPEQDLRDLTLEELNSKKKKHKLHKRNVHSEEWLFYDPSGTLITIQNLRLYCEEHGLSYGPMFFVYHGINRYKSHRGYKSAKHLKNSVINQ